MKEECCLLAASARLSHAPWWLTTQERIGREKNVGKYAEMMNGERRGALCPATAAARDATVDAGPPHHSRVPLSPPLVCKKAHEKIK